MVGCQGFLFGVQGLGFKVEGLGFKGDTLLAVLHVLYFLYRNLNMV